jgi:rubrerythrin
MKRLIDAEELLKAVTNANIESPEDAMDIIDHAPDAQPEPKTAYWRTHIFDGIMGGRPRAYMCGYCNFISFARTNYCPNCGAKMEVSGNE